MRHAANAGREGEPSRSGAIEAGLHKQKQARRVNNIAGTTKPTARHRGSVNGGRLSEDVMHSNAPSLEFLNSVSCACECE